MVINDIKLRGAHCGITSPRIPGRGHKDNNKSIIVISLRVHSVYPILRARPSPALISNQSPDHPSNCPHRRTIWQQNYTNKSVYGRVISRKYHGH